MCGTPQWSTTIWAGAPRPATLQASRLTAVEAGPSCANAGVAMAAAMIAPIASALPILPITFPVLRCEELTTDRARRPRRLAVVVLSAFRSPPIDHRTEELRHDRLRHHRHQRPG